MSFKVTEKLSRKVLEAYADAAYAAAAAHAYADAGKRNLILSKFGEAVVQILIEMKAPGTEFLYLTEG
jgi:hypothetical protein